MKDQNLQTLGDYFEAMGAGDRERAMTYYHDDVVLEVPGAHPASGTYEGLDGVKRFGATMAELTGGSFRLAPVDLLASDEHGVTIASVHAEADGNALDWQRVIVSKFRDGKLAHMRFFESDQDAVDELLAPRR